MSNLEGLRSWLGLLAVLPPCAVVLVIALSEYLLRAEGSWSGMRVLVWCAAGVACTGVTVGAWRMSRTTADAVHGQREAGTEAAQQQRQAEVAAVKQQQATERRAVSQWITHLQSSLADGLKEVQSTLDQLHRGEQPQVRELPPEPADPHPFAMLERDVLKLVHGVQLALTDSSARQERAAVLSTARRLLTSINNTLKAFDDFERQIDDPVVLKPVFALDHAVTRLRRLAESLALAGGAAPRAFPRPMPLSDVIGHAISEIEQYPRVKMASPANGLVDGRVAPGLVHAVSELLDNAATFSNPSTPVAVLVEEVGSGVLIQIEDRGISMPQEDLKRVNNLLSEPSRHRAGDYLRDGRMGLWVVAEYARRLGFSVRIQSNFYGGIQAEVRIPFDLFTETPRQQKQAARRDGPSAAPVHAPGSDTPTTDTRATGPTRTAPGLRPVASTSAGPRTGASTTAGGGRPALPTRRPNSEAHQPPEQVPSETPGGSASSDDAPLPRRDKTRSYLAPQLQNAAPGAQPRAEPTAPPNAGLMSTLAAGRLRAEQDSQPDSPQSLDPTDPPQTLEAPRGEHEIG
ncbi:sensor histidine kinase [Streptomyces antibioticus]|uniref:sensor histidine kinase n=1 Tax=Streptomyces antibioticus TaxID=1890 RepID=UPI0033BCEECD